MIEPVEPTVLPKLPPGSFASPVCGGPPRQAAGALLRALESLVGEIEPSFVAAVHHHCARLATLTGAPSVGVQLLRRDPAEPEAGYAPSSERFHIDLDPADPTREGLRLVRVLSGEGTWWIPVTREPAGLRSSLAHYQDAMVELERSRSIHEVLAPDHTLLLRGGLERGLIHRAPPCTHARLLLVASITQ
jgi:hypothetical protein